MSAAHQSSLSLVFLMTESQGWVGNVEIFSEIDIDLSLLVISPGRRCREICPVCDSLRQHPVSYAGILAGSPDVMLNINGHDESMLRARIGYNILC